MNNQKLRLTILTLIILIKANFAIGQTDTVKYPIFDWSIETGVIFPQNDDFYNIYNSKSNFNLRFGLKFGNSTWKTLPWVKYSMCTTKMDTLLTFSTKYDSMAIARRNQIAIGVVSPIKLKGNNYIQLKYGLTYNFLLEETTRLETNVFGLLMSVGYMKRFSNFLSYYIDINYDYAKTRKAKVFNDWSGFVIMTGVSFNVAQ